MKVLKINIYLLTQIFKYFLLILFIFLSISWILQLTRLLTISNFMDIEIIDIIFLSFYLIPNIITIITPFIIIFGLLLCFIKLNNDNELITIVSLGHGLKHFKKVFIFFSFGIVVIFLILNLYIAPKIYEQYKIKEQDLRNTLDFSKITFSNFLNLNETTILDFNKNENGYEDIFISFKDRNENLIYAKKGNIYNNKNEYNFQLSDGFKISVDNKNQIEKLEFLNYILKIERNTIKVGKIIDKNTLTIFDDINTKNYLNITYKIFDLILIIYIFYFFYQNNLKNLNLTMKNNIFFLILCIFILICNQILKNSEILIASYTFSLISIIIFISILTSIKKYYE